MRIGFRLTEVHVDGHRVVFVRNVQTGTIAEASVLRSGTLVSESPVHRSRTWISKQLTIQCAMESKPRNGAKCQSSHRSIRPAGAQTRPRSRGSRRSLFASASTFEKEMATAGGRVVPGSVVGGRWDEAIWQQRGGEARSDTEQQEGMSNIEHRHRAQSAGRKNENRTRAARGAARRRANINIKQTPVADALAGLCFSAVPRS